MSKSDVLIDFGGVVPLRLGHVIPLLPAAQTQPPSALTSLRPPRLLCSSSQGQVSKTLRGRGVSAVKRHSFVLLESSRALQRFMTSVPEPLLQTFTHRWSSVSSEIQPTMIHSLRIIVGLHRQMRSSLDSNTDVASLHTKTFKMWEKNQK